MSALAKVFYTPEQYLEMERVSEFRHEYHKGEIFAMAGGTQRHNTIALNTAFALRSQLKGKRCGTFVADMRVWIDAAGLYTYPDVVVTCNEKRYKDDLSDTLLNPSVIVEVLSKSTASYDRNEKFAFYKEIPSFTDYLLIAQDRYSVTHFVRQPGGEWPDTGIETTAPDNAVTIRSLDCMLALTDIYDQVEFAASDSTI